MKLNLHDPKTRKRVLIGGAGLGLVVAFLIARRNSTTAAAQTAAVGTTTDPTAATADPLAGLATTSGVPAALAGDPGTITTPADPTDVAAAVSDGVAGALGSIDWSSLFAPVMPTSDPTAVPVPAPTPPPAPAPIYTPPPPSTVISTVDELKANVTRLGYNPYLTLFPATPEAIAATAAATPVKVLTQFASPSAPVNVAPVSGVATPTPPPPVTALPPPVVPAPAPPPVTKTGKLVAF